MHKITILLVGAVVFCGVAAILFLNPLSATSVAVVVGPIHTNRYRDDSLVAVSVTISNSSPAPMAFDTTYQTKTSSGWGRPSTINTWHSSSGDDWSPMQPFTARMVHVPVPGKTDAPWRVVLRCTGTYKAPLSVFDRLRLKAYLFVFRREPECFFLSGEQPANPVLQATAAPPSN